MTIAQGQVFSFITLLIYCIAVLMMIGRARKGMKIPELYQVPGLEAMDEAIGRCTEMGRPLHFSPGIAGVDDAQTLAGLSILSYVAAQCAKYDTDIIVTNRRTVVYPISEEIVRQAFIQEGKLQNFKVENVRFISEDQFAYATGVTGIMYREKPAANLLLGGFWAESLVFAEVGATAGAIQIAGTANTHQIPFFVAACDYCLIGEELYAASAYLTREPILMGSIIVQDWGKMFAAICIVLGVILRTFNITFLTDIMGK
ncbi:MAG TPA: hypothetical protein GX729_03225 [Firmicutes bacterium]|nr:hypothetical protein [Bacillota bacterium]